MQLAVIRPSFFCVFFLTGGWHISMPCATSVKESAKLFYMPVNVIEIMSHNTILCGLPISFKTLIIYLQMLKED